jgi:MoaD family protein
VFEATRLNVAVEYLGYIKQTLKMEHGERIQLEEAATVRELLRVLAEKHGEPFMKAVYDPKDTDLKPHHILAVNGLILNQLDNLETKLKDGDRVAVMPVVTGG